MTAAEVREAMAANLLQRFFDDSLASLVAHIMGHESIDEAELQAIQELFSDSKKKGSER